MKVFKLEEEYGFQYETPTVLEYYYLKEEDAELHKEHLIESFKQFNESSIKFESENYKYDVLKSQEENNVQENELEELLDKEFPDNYKYSFDFYDVKLSQIEIKEEYKK